MEAKTPRRAQRVCGKQYLCGNGTAYVLKIKMNAYRGGVVQDIYVRNSTINQTIRGIVNWDSNFSESVPSPMRHLQPDHQKYLHRQRKRCAHVSNHLSGVRDFQRSFALTDRKHLLQEFDLLTTTTRSNPLLPATPTSFFKNPVIENVKFINPSTHAERVYNTNSAQFAGSNDAIVGSKTVPLTAQASPIRTWSIGYRDRRLQ